MKISLLGCCAPAKTSGQFRRLPRFSLTLQYSLYISLHSLTTPIPLHYDITYYIPIHDSPNCARPTPPELHTPRVSIRQEQPNTDTDRNPCIHSKRASNTMGKSQSKLSPTQLEDLQRATHFDKKELQQWYKGTYSHPIILLPYPPSRTG